MESNVNKNGDDLQSCIITTGVSSLNYYIEHMESFEKNNSLLYNYMKVNTIKNITKVDKYKVIIEFCDNNIKEIVFDLLNYLLPFNVDIYVKVIYDIALLNYDIEECMILLKRLDKHQLIELEIIYKSQEIQQEKESNSWINRFKKTFSSKGSKKNA